jgi:hypothetical protein
MELHGNSITNQVVSPYSCTVPNVLLQARLDRRAAATEQRGLRRELYRKYADPLTSAAQALYWRFREIFEDGRSGYLAPGGGQTRFETYKASSTRYRLACLLGWMTGLQKELTLVMPSPTSQSPRCAKLWLTLRTRWPKAGT